MNFSLKDKPGFKQFLFRLCILFGVVIFLPLATYPFLEMSRFPGVGFPNFNLTDVGMALIFFALAFTLISRNELLELKRYAYSIKEGIFFGFLTAFFIALYLYSRYVISNNFDYYAVQHYTPSLFFNLVPVLFLSISLILAVFNARFIKDFVSNFKKQLIISFIMSAFYYAFNIFIRKSWFFLGDFVANAVAFLLGLSFDNITLIDQGYNFTLGANGFVASIGDLCSGIDSIAFFTGLFILILAYDWKLLDKRKMLLIFVLGLAGVIIVNILRIYLLYLIGLFISPNFAVGIFHSNIGMVLFVAYFILFWWIFYRKVKNGN